MDKFINQIKETGIDNSFDAGIVVEINGEYAIGYEMGGAQKSFSVGQPVYDADGNIMGWLGIGLFENLNYDNNDVRIPCEYWKICLHTAYCHTGKKVYTYWQNKTKEEEMK